MRSSGGKQAEGLSRVWRAMSFACSTVIICPAAKSVWRCCAGIVGAALPGQSIVAYDPDTGLVIDMIAGEDAHQSERTLAIALLQGARPGQVWIADQHFCTRTLLTGGAQRGRASLCARTPSILACPVVGLGATVAVPTPARSMNKRLRLTALPAPGGASRTPATATRLTWGG
jgi:hypothetical protein